ncbi:Ribosome-interacting GTPase 2 [Cystobasidiomycetes sp. EMM_F5]
MAKTQKNKATEYHLGLLKAKLAKYRAQLLEPDKKSGKAGEGFDVTKSGDARVALIGFPSVGKSSLLSKMTNTESSVAAYEYTTLTAIPGVLEIEGARIQLLDLPGIIEGAASGRGRGRQVVAVAKTADLILIVLDVAKAEEQKRLLEIELEAIGIRINRKRPDVLLKPKKAGGVSISHTVPLTKIDEKTIRTILSGNKLHNMDVYVREDITVDEFIDVLIGNRRYVQCLYVYNKIDTISIERVDEIARQPNTVVISCEDELNLDGLRKAIWDKLGLLRVYTKPRGRPVDLNDPLVVRSDATVEDVCNAIHRSIASHFKYAMVHGKSSRFNPNGQRVPLSHKVADQDVCAIFTN